MRIVFKFILLFFLTSCIGQNKEKTITVVNESNVMDVQEKPKIPKEDAFQMNMGFKDNPVWVWAKYTHNLVLEDSSYNHIYGIDYWHEDGGVKTLYYEKDRRLEKKDSIDFSNYILKPYPGDKTLQLIGRYSDTLLLFNVLENKDLGRDFKGKYYRRVPAINVNSKKEKVSDYDVEFHFELKEKLFYEVTIINNEGINKFIFKSNCPLNKEFDVSYYDLTNDRIYLLDKNCYLEKVDL